MAFSILPVLIALSIQANSLVEPGVSESQRVTHGSSVGGAIEQHIAKKKDKSAGSKNKKQDKPRKGNKKRDDKRETHAHDQSMPHDENHEH